MLGEGVIHSLGGCHLGAGIRRLGRPFEFSDLRATEGKAQISSSVKKIAD